MTDSFNPEDAARILVGLVRIGTVMNIDKTNHMARVKFQDANLPSGWLRVLQHPGAELEIKPDGDHYHEAGILTTSEPKTNRTHNHAKSCLKYWTPNIDDAVLCLFIPTDDGDGYILGAV